MSTKLPFFPRLGVSRFHYAALVLACFSLASCSGSSSSGSGTLPPEDISEQDPDPLAGADNPGGLGTIEDSPVGGGTNGETPETVEPGPQTGRVGLIVSSPQRCAFVFDPLEVVVTRTLEQGEVAEVEGQLPNVTGLVTFANRFGTSLNLVSRDGDSANFEVSEQDIVGLTATIENGSVTTYLAGYDRDLPASFILRKPVTNGCLYAFKSGDSCSTGLTEAGVLQFNRNGASMSAVGCELTNPNNLPVVEIVPQ